MELHDHIVFGALLHDIGKFFERANRLDEYRNDNNQKQQDCPWQRQGGYWSHLHVLHTRRFCEELCRIVPILQPPSGQRDSQAADNWINMAAHHHVASTNMERLVQSADYFASAEREQGNFYEHGIHRRTRLEPILERINLKNENKTTEFRVNLRPLTTSGEDIFPLRATEFEPSMKPVGEDSICVSPTDLSDDYQRLADGLLNAMENVPKYDRLTPASLRSFMTTLLAQMERFLVTVPAATNVKHPDISLYDHLRVTAAIAEGLFLHHQFRNTLDQPDTFNDKATSKWRLVCGDFSGIQNFIYKITRKGAAKGLRGRSLYIQLLCDGVAEHLLRKLNLYPTARIYSSGGKFYLLTPDCLEQALKNEVATINKALIKEFQGDVFLGIGIAPVCGKDFAGGKMGERWKDVNDSLMRDRQQRFRPLLENDPSFFEVQRLASGPACGVCGRDDEDADIGSNDGPICKQCAELQRLGQSLTDAKAFFWVWKSDKESFHETGSTPIPLPGTDWDIHVYPQDHLVTPSALRSLSNCYWESINQITDPVRNENGYASGFRLLGKWDRDKKAGVWEFEEFDKNAKGIQRMGILRLDVDNLGEIFIRGLKFPGATGQEEEMGSLSRVATLSRQLHLFFAGHLMELLQPYQRSQIIYSGGDDIFLIGSWDELPEVAHKIRREFQYYCANNPAFTLSAGLTMVDGKYPISRAAGLAEEAESRAKALRRNRREKDAVCLLETVIGWEEYPCALKLRKQIETIIEKTENRAILDRLRSVVLAVEKFQRLSDKQNLQNEEMRELIHWQQWRWRLVYNLKRMARRNQEIKTDLDQLIETITESRTESIRPVIDWLQLPTRWAEFLTRRSK